MSTVICKEIGYLGMGTRKTYVVSNCTLYCSTYERKASVYISGLGWVDTRVCTQKAHRAGYFGLKNPLWVLILKNIYTMVLIIIVSYKFIYFTLISISE